jgi:hypothetical protein
VKLSGEKDQISRSSGSLVYTLTSVDIPLTLPIAQASFWDMKQGSYSAINFTFVELRIPHGRTEKVYQCFSPACGCAAWSLHAL